jgi:hypothetical protein
MAFGDKRDYPKIDVYADGKYLHSTTWCRTCKEAVDRARLSIDRPEVKVTARRAK